MNAGSITYNLDVNDTITVLTGHHYYVDYNGTYGYNSNYTALSFTIGEFWVSFQRDGVYLPYINIMKNVPSDKYRITHFQNSSYLHDTGLWY